MTNAALALEIKEADELDPAVAVTEAIAGLEKKFNDRLKTIETKSADETRLKARLDAMEAKLNRPGTIELKADNDNGGAESPAEQRTRTESARRQAAEDALRSDPVVQSLIETFDGRMIAGSVRPADGDPQ